MAHILIVDDSATDAKLFSAMLERAGHKVSHAVDAESGIARAKSEVPDLILMDVIMPRKTGFEACRELKRREDTKAIPVILVTTRGEGENVEAGFQSGCNDYVTKPINAQELLTKVRDHMGAR